jgi:hypothetical protein
MKTYQARIEALLAICVLGLGTGMKGDQPRPLPAPAPAPLRLEVSLTDGSLLVGETYLDTLPVIPEGMGKIDIKFGFIDSISFSQDQPQVKIVFRNGDRVQGSFANAFSIPLKTILGELAVPISAVREIEVRGGGAGRLVDWAPLKFPPHSNWSDQGEPAAINPNEIVFKGQPVWTEQVLPVPTSFECDITLDQLVADDGCLWIILIPAAGDPEMDIPPQNVAIQLGYHQKAGDSGMFTISHGGGGAPKDLGAGAFTLEAGKACHVKVDVSEHSIRATLNGQTYEDDHDLPFNQFRIELMGWQPTNVWHVRNWVVR